MNLSKVARAVWLEAAFQTDLWLIAAQRKCWKSHCYYAHLGRERWAAYKKIGPR